MVAGLLLTQVAGSILWATQLRAKTEADVKSAAQYLGQGAAKRGHFAQIETAIQAQFTQGRVGQQQTGGTITFELGQGRHHMLDRRDGRARAIVQQRAQLRRRDVIPPRRNADGRGQIGAAKDNAVARRCRMDFKPRRGAGMQPHALKRYHLFH